MQKEAVYSIYKGGCGKVSTFKAGIELNVWVLVAKWTCFLDMENEIIFVKVFQTIYWEDIEWIWFGVMVQVESIVDDILILKMINKCRSGRVIFTLNGLCIIFIGKGCDGKGVILWCLWWYKIKRIQTFDILLCCFRYFISFRKNMLYL